MSGLLVIVGEGKKGVGGRWGLVSTEWDHLGPWAGGSTHQPPPWCLGRQHTCHCGVYGSPGSPSPSELARPLQRWPRTSPACCPARPLGLFPVGLLSCLASHCCFSHCVGLPWAAPRAFGVVLEALVILVIVDPQSPRGTGT